MSCPCGYSKDLRLGAGMQDFRERADFPHLCPTCGVVSANILAQPSKCPHCGDENLMMYGERAQEREVISTELYVTRHDQEEWISDPRVTMPSGNAVETWLKLRITESRHFCPACSNFDLAISVYGFFD